MSRPMIERNPEVGKRLRRSRERKRLTQTKLADISGITNTTISGIETGVKGLSDTNASILGKILGVSPAWLLCKSNAETVEDQIKSIEEQHTAIRNAALSLLDAAGYKTAESKYLIRENYEYIDTDGHPCVGLQSGSFRGVFTVKERNIYTGKYNSEAVLYGSVLDYAIDAFICTIRGNLLSVDTLPRSEFSCPCSMHAYSSPADHPEE